MINIIAAYDQNRLIGVDGSLPWHLPADMKHFRELTIGNVVIMGRKTFESVGRPLPRRENIIISRNEDFEAEGCRVVQSFDDAIKIAEDLGEIWVIGGAQIYRLALPVADQLHLTVVDAQFEGNVYFPEINPNEWRLVDAKYQLADEQNPYNLTFSKYERAR